MTESIEEPNAAAQLNARIHCGADQIGGSCVELEFAGKRLVIDVGRPLSANRGTFVPLPAVPGLAVGDPSILAVLISHGHQDHWGLIDQVHPSIPRYIGRGAADVLRVAQFWGPGIDMRESGHFVDREPLTLGPFVITPYLVDHSGFDAYALLIEAGGRRVMYSGDFRGHGRKSAIFDRMLADPPREVDALLLEGTHVGHFEDVHGLRSESEVEACLAETARSTDGAVVAINSAQNIDRLVSCFRAAKRSRRDLVIDLYTAEITAATGRATIPRAAIDWPHVKVLVPATQRLRVLKSKAFNKVEQIRNQRVYSEDIAAAPGDFLIAGSYQSEVPRMLRTGLLVDGVVVWSLWSGYLAEPSGVRLQEALASAGVPLVQNHTSGHANIVDLRRLVKAVEPREIVPIHTEHPGSYSTQIGAASRRHPDGQWWQVGSTIESLIAGAPEVPNVA